MGWPEGRRFEVLVGVGGIGWGTFFAVDGDHTLGREESRAGRYLDRRDYCKLHIVCHYVRALLGPRFPVLPVGMVGDDEPGRRLMAEMGAAGLDLRHVERSATAPTLSSFCIVYPDGSGGNLTTSASAAALVDAAFVSRAAPELQAHGGRGIALALPEVPLEARAELLRLATVHGAFRVASFTSGELPSALEQGIVGQTDLLALNRDEARTVAPTLPAVVERLRAENPRILVSITEGRDGGWSWDGTELRHRSAPAVTVQGAAGAGDAHLAGVVAGLAAGLQLRDAHQLGGLVAAMAVTSPHTIDTRIMPAALAAFAGHHSIGLTGPVRAFLDGDAVA